MQLTHRGTQTIETGRLILRRFEQGDAGDMYRNWAGDDQVSRYLTWPTHASEKISAKVIGAWIIEYQSPGKYEWAICHKRTGQAIGSISLMGVDDRNRRCEAGYCLGRKYWGQGIMTEAFKAVIAFGFVQVGFERIQALHHVGNPASGRVMQKAGLTHEGRLRSYFVIGGRPCDCEIYSILREEWEKQKRVHSSL